MKDYYKILELDKNATNEEIKKSYRKLSMKYHPDKNNNNRESTEKFKELNEAYETLCDKERKNMYDAPKKQQQNLNEVFNVNDIFNFMNNMQSGKLNNTSFPYMKPEPIIKEIEIDIFKSYTGTTEPIEIKRWILENNIKREETEVLYVPIPEGIDNKEIIVIQGKGNIINDKVIGDIKIHIKIINNTDLKREGLDINYTKLITLKESLCGFSFQLNLINGKNVVINNNKGSIIAPNTKKIIHNMGMKRNNYIGNLIINFIINYPTILSMEQIDNLEKIL